MASQLLRFPSSVSEIQLSTSGCMSIRVNWGRSRSAGLKSCATAETIVRELLHDGHPTACVGDAAFAYVNAFTAHVNVGFFRGAEIADPKGLLEGTGKFMRHVKLRPERDVDASALMTLVETAYTDMKERLNVPRGVRVQRAGRSLDNRTSKLG